MQWQQLAAIPEEKFEEALAAPGKPTTAGILRREPVASSDRFLAAEDPPMIARLTLITDFNIALPKDQPFNLYTYEDGGYQVTVYPPVVTDQPLRGSVPESVTIDGMPGFLANGLRIDFQKEQFDRGRSRGVDRSNVTVDPPAAIVFGAVNSFLRRLRYVARGFMIQPIDMHRTSWSLQYLNDDGTELTEDPDRVRRRVAVRVSFSMLGISSATWDDSFELPPEFEAPVWDDLRLDAQNALPHVGTSIVLSYAALETFINRILDAVVAQGSVAPELWHWITNRKNFLQDPSTEEQYDVLLKLLVGHSLKEDGTLWESFQNLRRARNSFVHEGQAIIGKDPVDDVTAQKLVNRVGEIIAWVRQWLPEQAQWPEFPQTTKVESSIVLFKSAPVAETDTPSVKAAPPQSKTNSPTVPKVIEHEMNNQSENGP